MKIALIGYGKMGHAIERHALKRGHEIVCRIDVDNTADFDSEAFRSADAAIEFTTPATAFDNCRRAVEASVPTISGTTAWQDRLGELAGIVDRLGGKFMWSSNYSIGVNIFFELNRRLAEMMNRLSNYTPTIKEIHHIHKIDHPSGTAVTIANGIIDSVERINGWSEDASAGSDTLYIAHERKGEVPGTHIVTWDSAVDTITIEHSAKSRDGFALGAVMAAEWLVGAAPGVHTINEMMSEI